MSVFSIKLKTKAGNDIKKKETFTCLFRLRYKKNAITKKITAEYTYRIMFSGGAADPKSVLEIRDSHLVDSIEDLTLKVVLNLCHVVTKLSADHKLTPDFVLFMSPDLDSKKNKAWTFLKDALHHEKPKKKKAEEVTLDNYKFKLVNHLEKKDDKWNYDFKQWTESVCKKLGIKKSELLMLKDFVELNPTTTFMSFDPNRDKERYKKSLVICDHLQERIDRQITQKEDSKP